LTEERRGAIETKLLAVLWILLYVVIIIHCIRHRGAPYLRNAMIGLMMGGVPAGLGLAQGWLTNGRPVGSGHELGAIMWLAALSVGAVTGGAAGAAVGIGIAGFAPNNTARTIGALLGTIAGLAAGWPLMLFFPPEHFERMPQSIIFLSVFIPAGVIGELLGADLGTCYSRSRSRGVLITGGVSMMAAVVPIIVIFPRITTHTRPVAALEQEGNREGLLYKIASGQPWGVRSSAAIAYARLDPDAALRHHEQQVRYLAALQLSRQRDPRAVPVLIEATNDEQFGFMPPVGVRHQAAQALGVIGNADAARALSDLTRHHDVKLREIAIEQLSRIRAPQGQGISSQTQPADDEPAGSLLGSMRTLRWSRGTVTGAVTVAFSPDSRMIASGNPGYTDRKFHGEVRLWEVQTGALRQTLATGSGTNVSSIAFSPDGQWVASASWDLSVNLWQAGTGQLRWSTKGRGRTVAFSADGKTVASGGEGATLSWEAATGRPRPVGAGIQVSSDRSAASRSGAVRALLTQNGNESAVELRRPGQPPTILEAASPAFSVSVSPDGTLLASGHKDYSVRLWDVRTGKLLRVVKTVEWPSSTGTNAGVICVVFSPDGRWLGSGDSSGNAVIWRVKAD
jgi:hypothetical protein